MDYASKNFYNRPSKGSATPEGKLKVTVKVPNMKVI